MARDISIEVLAMLLLGPRDCNTNPKAGGLATLLRGSLAIGGPRRAGAVKHPFDTGYVVAPAFMARSAIGGHVPEDEAGVTSTSSMVPQTVARE